MLLSDKRIFIVEDNLINSIIVEKLLQQHGATVHLDRWGMDAVNSLRAFAPIHLILLDLMLSNRWSGFDVFNQIRSYQEFADVPIVAVSAADAATAIPETQERGFFGFIGKPIDFKLFPTQIARILAGEHLWYSISQF